MVPVGKGQGRTAAVWSDMHLSQEIEALKAEKEVWSLTFDLFRAVRDGHVAEAL